MKLTYVSHASFLIEANGTKLVTDPWYFAPAYHNQWHVFPKPLNTGFITDVQHIILTHAHEDHFHPETLQHFNKSATVYLPYTWKGGQKNVLNKLGFKNVIEVQSRKKVTINSDLEFTFIINGLDAFVVYKVKGKTIVNLNDALNASHKYFIRLFTKIIKDGWGKIDYLICGLGGAGYFPNMVHSPLKNDYEIGHLREQFLAHKFCEIVEMLAPEIIIPFVPGFALLEKDNLWINEVRFPRTKLKKYYNDYFVKDARLDFYSMLPGDDITDGIWNKKSGYHQVVQDDQLVRLLKDQYGDTINQINTYPEQDAEVLVRLCKKLNRILGIKKAGISNSTLRKINFAITLEDVKGNSIIHCKYENGVQAKICTQCPEDIQLNIRTHSWKLEYAIDNLWGGDIFYIGYGAHVDVLDHSCLEDNMDIVSIRMLSRFPSALENIPKEPWRAARYFLNNVDYAKLAINQKVKTFNNLNKLPFNERDHWIQKSKCEVCRLCDMPLLSDEFGEMLSEKAIA